MQPAACAKHARGFDGRWRDEAAGKIEDYERCGEANQIKRKNECRNPMVGHCVVSGRLREGVAPSRMGRHHAEMVRVVEGDEKKDEKETMEEMHNTEWRK